MRPTPEVVRKWSAKQKYANQDSTMCLFHQIWDVFKSDTIGKIMAKYKNVEWNGRAYWGSNHFKKEERAMRPTPEVVRKWSSKLCKSKQYHVWMCVFCCLFVPICADLGWFGPIWADLSWFGLIWDDLDRIGLIWDDLGWFRLIWADLGWLGLIWADLGWFGLIWTDLDWFGMI